MLAHTLTLRKMAAKAAIFTYSHVNFTQVFFPV